MASAAPGASTMHRAGRARRQRPGQRERAAARALKLAEELEMADVAAHEQFLAGPTGDGPAGETDDDPASGAAGVARA
eukprot:13729204-Alexandrium_andersonii.AAC.1